MEPDRRRLAEVVATRARGCFVIENHGEPAGTATTTSYGKTLGWIGMVLVHPDQRRKGMATALMKRCLDYLFEEREVTTVRLDATPAGKEVYEKLGFTIDYGLSRWEGPALPGPESQARHRLEPDARSLDKVAFGTDRYSFLERLADDSIVETSGTSYGMIRPGAGASYLGPLVSDSAEKGRELVSRLLRLASTDAPVYWDIPDLQKQAVAFARELGFTRQRRLLRMSAGPRRISDLPELQWAIGAPETG